MCLHVVVVIVVAWCMVQYQQMRADEGDVPSMVAMGDLLYWGARYQSVDAMYSSRG